MSRSIRVLLGVIVAVAGSVSHPPAGVAASSFPQYCAADVAVLPDDTQPHVVAITAVSAQPGTVQGDLVLHAGDGWYTVSVPPANLAPQSRQYRTDTTQFTRTVYVSDPIYVRLASATGVRSAFFVSKTHSCDTDGTRVNWAVKQPGDPVASQPASVSDPKTATPLVAKPLPVPGSLSCAEPFKDAHVISGAMPQFPAAARFIDRPHVALVRVAVSSTGSIEGAEVFQPSGIGAIDSAGVNAALNSTYSPARAFCQDVPGYAVYRIEVDPK